MPFTPPKKEPISPCRNHYCAFSAMCLVNKTSGQPYCQCIRNCSGINSPICGSDDFTYNSLCEMKKASCLQERRIKIRHKGKCIKGKIDPCTRVKCDYGSKCVTTKDGTHHRCVCPLKCNSNGDNVDDSPVCGSDHVEYANECELRKAACYQMKEISIKYFGKCGKVDPCTGVKCDFGAKCVPTKDGTYHRCVCPLMCYTYGDHVDSSPVCGSDHVEYANKCELRKAACNQMKEISIKFFGKCDPCAVKECQAPLVCLLDDNRTPVCGCQENCDDTVNMVCGDDGRTYSNECRLRMEACKTQRDIKIHRFGKCPEDNPCNNIVCRYGRECKIDRQNRANCECPVPCQKILRPVCGSNRVTYDNECELRRQACIKQQNVQLAHRGPCGGPDKCRNINCEYGSVCVVKGGMAVCECALCSEEFREVCGNNGVTYQNECKMRQDGCKKRIVITKQHDGNCNGCGEHERCEFYSTCDRSQNVCICPNSCDSKEAKVCGSDGVTYQNECFLRISSCKKKLFIMVASAGECELCSGKNCLNGARCENGKCVCPVICPTIYNPVCGTDGVTYSNECEMKKRACLKNIDLDKVEDGQCSEMSGGESGDGPSGENMPDCDESNCQYNGVCQMEEDGSYRCICNFNCEAIRLPVCGSDGKTYGSKCQMREESCRQQRQINEIPMDNCDVLAEEACDGNLPLIDPRTRREYNCSNNYQACPESSYCHVSYGKCCQEEKESENIKGCQATKYGCCPDGVTASPDPNQRGCPRYCNCNPIGSLGFTCEPKTRQCVCKPGVGGKRCDFCMPGYWGITQIQSKGNDGCLPCACNPLGSKRDDCEQMRGVCMCKPGVTGDKCDVCPDSTYVDVTGCNGVLSEGKSCSDIVCAFYGICVERNGFASCSCNLPCVTQNQENSVTVCGSDGNTYPNECRLKVDSCSSRREISVRYLGPCIGSGTSARPATSLPLTERSRKTTRHVAGSNGQVTANLIKSTERPPNRPPIMFEGRIWDICLDDSYCKVENSQCRTGVCQCNPGFIATLENTRCSEVVKEKVAKVPDNHGQHNPCSLNPCKFNGSCELDDSLGYRCLCPLGKTGPICRDDTSVQVPSFSGKSYLALAEVAKPDNDITIEIGFTSYSHDGILLYSSQYRNGSGDFISITLKNGYLEFRYDLGSGIAVLNSPSILNLNQPYQIIVNRMGREGMLEVKGGTVIEGSSPPSLTSLNLKGPMYLGYVPEYVEVAFDRMEVATGFVGCITSFKAGTTEGDHQYNLAFPQMLVTDIRSGQDIAECGSNPCQSLPCQNGGSCQMLYVDTFKCSCATGFSGDTCGEILHPCADSPCKDGSSCTLTDTGGYKCICPDNREGEFCEYERLEKIFIPEFIGTSFIQLPLEDTSLTSLSIKIWFKTLKPDGVLLYAMQFSNGLGDFISLNIIDRMLEFRFNVGVGTVVIRSNKDIQIDQWHEVMIQKIGRFGTLLIDNDDNKRYVGESEGYLTELNLQSGYVYLGGFKNKFTIPRDSNLTTNFTGVIQRIYINSHHIDNIMETATDSHSIIEYIGPPCNVNPCLNGGVCIPRLNEVDCKCPKKFLGQRCEKRADNLIKDSPIRFDGNIHLQYANEITHEQKSQRRNRYNIRFKTTEPGGLLLYQNGNTAILGDYLAIAIVNGKVEFSYNLGKQTEDDLHIIRSAVKVNDGQWHRLIADRDERSGSLKVDNETPVTDISKAGATQLDTNGQLWIGGKTELPLGLPLDYRRGFIGCISEVYINDVQLHLFDHRNGHSTNIMRFCK